jgi:hypothetical protein
MTMKAYGFGLVSVSVNVSDLENRRGERSHCDHDLNTMTWKTGARGETLRNDR